MPVLSRRADAGNGRSVAVLTLDNPPVNALSFAFSELLVTALVQAENDPGVVAIVLTGNGAIFSGGADVNDFNGEPAPGAKTVRDAIAAVERSAKTYVAAIDGNALGGGLELALACDYRVAARGAKVGLPEIKLGLIPGAGGTQRLPRLIGAQAALEFALKGNSHAAAEAAALGILDEIVDGDMVEAAVTLAAKNAGEKRRLSERRAFIGTGISPQAGPFVVSQAHKLVPPEDRGGFAAHKVIDAIEAAVELPFAFGIAREARLFEELVRSAPSAALRHLFFAQRELNKIPGLAPAEPLEIRTAGVIGAGTMGSGIAIAFAQAGIPVTVVDPNDDAVAKARQTVMGMFAYQVHKGRLTQEEAWTRGRSITFTDDWNELAGANVVVEAVFEDLSIKQDVFRKLDGIAKPQAVLATNTSTLDVDAIAAVTARPEMVAGLHFFVPANIMPLLEIVRAKATSPQTIATAFKLGKTLRKTAVLSANAFGFIGNRMIFDYAAEALALAEEGVAPWRVDAVMKAFGFPMGPFAMSDLSGLEVAWHITKARDPQERGRTGVLEQLVERGRLGQKTLAGYFKYDPAVGKGREPIVDPEVETLFAQAAREAGIAPRNPADDEIRDRLLYALINRGAYLLADGVALRPGDIDIVYVYGYGFPAHEGGPMWYADAIGVSKVYAAIERFRASLGARWTPAPLLAELAAASGTFAEHGRIAPELARA
ncbi:MAG TPA: 3-hydroxyacyl-CoA dehydrogenase NAD-binding domain-containing protein [Candidatus Tumulicola sp.]|jgi:3-hydroxyacyl-CoA dehydrogenase